MRVVKTPTGERVFYSADEVPAVIEEAVEMIWRPFPFWHGHLARGEHAGDPYRLTLWVDGRYVYDGEDPDIRRLLGHFQGFLDSKRRYLGDRRFRRVMYRGSPTEAATEG